MAYEITEVPLSRPQNAAKVLTPGTVHTVVSLSESAGRLVLNLSGREAVFAFSCGGWRWAMGLSFVVETAMAREIRAARLV